MSGNKLQTAKRILKKKNAAPKRTKIILAHVAKRSLAKRFI